jgi:ABC-type uncharacterized transport system substrate-binding protein
LVNLGPDLILASGSPTLEATRLASKAMPIVFVAVIDPVSQGYVMSLAHPGLGRKPIEVEAKLLEMAAKHRDP